MESGGLRRLAVVGFLALIAMMLLYLFAANQVTDSDTPRVKAAIEEMLGPSLDAQVPVTLHAWRLGKGLDAPRHYRLVLAPAERVLAAERGVDLLVRRAAEMFFDEIGKKRARSTLTCVAVLHDGERRVTFDAALREVAEPDVGPVTEDDG